MAKVTARQHERLRVPDGWQGQARALVLQLERIHDDIYNRLIDAGIIEDLEANVALAQEDIDNLESDAGVTAGAIAIIAEGDEHIAITEGQYVLVRSHGTLTPGLYVATANIVADGALSGSNVTAVSDGGLNDLADAIATESAKWTDGNTVRLLSQGNSTIDQLAAKIESANTNGVIVFGLNSSNANTLVGRSGAALGLAKNMGSNSAHLVIFQGGSGNITMGTFYTNTKTFTPSYQAP